MERTAKSQPVGGALSALSDQELARLLTTGELEEKEGLYAQRLLRQRQQAMNQRRRRLTMAVAMCGAAAASLVLSAIVVGLVR